MGNCCGFKVANQFTTPETTGTLSSGGRTRASRTTSTTNSSNVSSKSQFSESSGGDEVPPNGEVLPAPNLKAYTFQELKTATRNFKGDALLGEGGFGKVYRGWLESKNSSKSNSGMVVAIKKLNDESLQGFHEWQAEVDFLGRLSHPNLVKLLGYCWEDKEFLLIYEFMQRGSLENHLFGRHLYIKSDVYSFGVVIAELLTGQRALDTTRPSGRHSLVDWIKPYLADKRKLKTVMDSRLEGKYPLKAAIATAELSLKCLAQEPKNRPSMQEVLDNLLKIQAMDEKRRVARRGSTGNNVVRPHGHIRSNGVRSNPNSLRSR